MYAYTVLIFVWIFSCCITMVTVNWTIAMKHIVLGSDLQLECRVTEDNRNESWALKRWTGGSGDQDICTNKKCIKKDKYEMQNDQSKPSFNLTIKNVDEIDIRERFTCWYNFESSSGTIISQKDIIIFDQTGINEQTSNYIIDGNYLDVNITLGKVYPVPTCSGTVEYEDKFIVYLNKSLNTRSTKLPSGLYQAEVNGTLEFPLTTSCDRGLKLTCYFNSVPITIFATNSTHCGRQESKEANEGYAIFIILFGVFLVMSVLAILVFIIFYKYFYTERKRSVQKKRYTPVQTKETHDEENQDVNGTIRKQQNGNKRISSRNTRQRRHNKRRFQTYP